MKILRSSEDYLEAMLILGEKNGFARSVDIAELLQVTKPSVTYATKRLRENGYISMDPDGHITLEGSGRAIAEKMLERHKLLTRFLIDIGVSSDTAETDACRLEHDLSEESFEAICRYAETIKE